MSILHTISLSIKPEFFFYFFRWCESTGNIFSLYILQQSDNLYLKYSEKWLDIFLIKHKCDQVKQMFLFGWFISEYELDTIRAGRSVVIELNIVYWALIMY